MSTWSQDNPHKFNNEYTSSDIFYKQLTDLKEKLPLIFESFEKSFVLHRKNPEDNEYKQIFVNDKNNLEQVVNDQFVLENNVTTNIHKINSDLAKMYAEIEILKKRNVILLRKQNHVSQQATAADKRYDNFQDLYEMVYLKNWAIFCSILVLVIVMYNIFPFPSSS